MNESSALILERRFERIALLRLNRPDVRNAINQAMLAELVDSLDRLDADDSVRVIVITGDDTAFAAGADLREMADLSAVEMQQRPQVARWHRIASRSQTTYRCGQRTCPGWGQRTGDGVRHRCSR